MKYLTRFKKTDTGRLFIDMQLVQDEFIYEYHEIEELLPKEGHYIKTYWDEEEKKLKQKYVAIPMTEEEKVQLAIQKELSKNIKVDELKEEEIKEKLLLFPKYSQETTYKIGDCVQHLGKLYKCKKEHTSSYDLLPQLATDYWQEVKGVDNKPKKEREFWSGDKTYRKGDEVIYYGKPYEYIADKPEAGKNPENSPKHWKLIVE